MMIFRFNLTSSISWSSEIGTESTSVLSLWNSERPWFRLSMTPGEGAAKFEHYFSAIRSRRSLYVYIYGSIDLLSMCDLRAHSLVRPIGK